MLEHIDAQHSVAYVKKQQAGISFFLRLFGQVDVTKAAVVKQFLKGWHKEKFVADKRKPITLDLLHKLLLVSESVCLSDYEATLFKLLFLLMFFAALRVSEAVSASKLKQGGLHVNDVQLINNKLRVLIKKSKTDQLWIGSFERLNLCPVKAYESFLAIRPNVDGSFFIHSDGLPKLNMEPKAYKSHSFRIGAATQASLLGFGEGFIRRLGRWDSKRYRSFPVNRVKIHWLGIRGAVWNDLWQLFSLMLHKWGTPDIVIIHLGGNDIGKTKIWDLSRQIKRDLAVLHFNLPQAIIGWSEMVSRLPWLQQPNLKALERCKKKLNFGIYKFMKSLNLLTYRHEELELGGDGLRRRDGIHLSDIGNDIFNVGLQNAIEKAMFKWECANYTFPE
ncbi:hypothetical protein XELAEV_18013634mg [Xenopus laevis]|uniref:SGNH hydrolase-type esterase domain-containing protein n=1 Tax=Xenopus laevis TaxID=8355 RepID=A0A974HZJ0_XENLA|nr:hypothetical protein XELAEV_18013634mg [Xenopus laevis]